MCETTQRLELTTTQRVTLALVGLGLDGGGVLAVEQALRALVGVRYVYVCAATEMAYVVYDGDRVRPDQLVTAVERVGFHAATPERR
jgi:copper chaperone CopZ